MATINHKTYNEGTETFKDFSVYDGKDTLIFKVDGSEGNVGIGTASPSQRLDIAAGAIKFERITTGALTCTDSQGLIYSILNNVSTIDGLRYAARSHRFVSHADTVYATIDADGLKFGSDTAAANALDDYEEGTWTMGVSFGGSSAGVTIANNTGTYTKIGRQVTVTGYANLTSKGSATGAAAITGLPFTILNTLTAYSAVTLHLDKVTFANQYSGYGVVGNTFIELREVTEAGVGTALTNADFADDSSWVLSLTYFV
jgi:hypothetical protein